MTKVDKEMMLEFLALAESALDNFAELAAKYPRLSGQEMLIHFINQEIDRTHTWLSVQQVIDEK